jgi:Leucine-rich repeat (LRR) protein
MKLKFLLIFLMSLSWGLFAQNSVERMIFRSLEEVKEFDPEQIRNLYLENKGYSKIPDSVFLFVNLEKLSLKGNQIRFVPDEIGQLKNLNWLELKDNQIDSISAEISQLQKLERLNLYHNELKQLPLGMKTMDSLKVLNISRNPISEEALKFVFSLDQLKELNLSKLRLQKLPEEIGNLVDLEFLSLFCNQIDSLPSSISNLQKLEVFNAGNNPRIFVPENFSELKNMKRMYWVGNQWKQLPKAIESMDFVQDCYLTNHQFSEEEIQKVKALLPNTRLNIDE